MKRTSFAPGGGSFAPSALLGGADRGERDEGAAIRGYLISFDARTRPKREGSGRAPSRRAERLSSSAVARAPSVSLARDCSPARDREAGAPTMISGRWWKKSLVRRLGKRGKTTHRGSRPPNPSPGCARVSSVWHASGEKGARIAHAETTCPGVHGRVKTPRIPRQNTPLSEARTLLMPGRRAGRQVRCVGTVSAFHPSYA